VRIELHEQGPWGRDAFLGWALRQPSASRSEVEEILVRFLEECARGPERSSRVTRVLCVVKALQPVDGRALTEELARHVVPAVNPSGPNDHAEPRSATAGLVGNRMELYGATTLARLFRDVITRNGDGWPEFTGLHRHRLTQRIRQATGAGVDARGAEDALTRAWGEIDRDQAMLVQGAKGLLLNKLRVESSARHLCLSGDVAGVRPSPIPVRRLHHGLAEAIADQNTDLGVCQSALDRVRDRDRRFFEELARAGALSGVGDAACFSVRKKAPAAGDRGREQGQELWLCYRLPPFMVEVSAQGLILDYSEPEAAASVVIRLSASAGYPAHSQFTLYLHAHTREGRKSWAHYPNVNGSIPVTDVWALCCAEGPATAVETARKNHQSPGRFLKQLLQVGHDAVLLGYRASNPNNVYHTPGSLVAAGPKGKAEHPYRVLSRAAAQGKQRQGTILVPYAR
jgi:hypothetical protein